MAVYLNDVMSMDEVKAHAIKYSKGYSSAFSPWKTNLEEMAKKTEVSVEMYRDFETGKQDFPFFAPEIS